MKPRLRTILALTLAATACSHAGAPSAIGSADGHATICISDDGHGPASPEIIGGADSATEIYVAGEESPATKGPDMIRTMHRLSGSEEYLAVAASGSASDDIRRTVAQIAAGKYDRAEKIFVIDIPQGSSHDGDPVKEIISDRLLRSAATRINSASGSAVLAATALLFVDDAFVCPAVTRPQLWLYLFDGDYHAMVAYRPCGNSIAAATACFVKFPASENISSAEEVKRAVAAATNMPDIEVTEYEPLVAVPSAGTNGGGRLESE